MSLLSRRSRNAVWFALFPTLAACGGTAIGGNLDDGGASPDGFHPDASPGDSEATMDARTRERDAPTGDAPMPTDAAPDAPSTCDGLTFPAGHEPPPWVTHSCPVAGCPAGTVCVYETVDVATLPVGCAPIPDTCSGAATCGCAQCLCGGLPCHEPVDPGGSGLVCITPTQ